MTYWCFSVQVHPRFRLVVHLSESIKAPAPFYNRFEKYRIGLKGVWEDMMRSHSEDTEVLEQVSRPCRCYVLHPVSPEFVLVIDTVRFMSAARPSKM